MIIKNSFKKTCHEKEVKKKPPSPSICLPMIGHMHVMAKYHENHWDGFSAIARSLGNVYFVKMGIRKIVVVNSLESIREVLLSKGEIFVNRPDFQRYHAIFNGDRENALALCDWSRTQRIRRIVAQMVILPRFGSGMLDSLNKCIRVDINDFLGIKMKQLESTTSLSSPSSTLITKSEILFLFGNIFSNYLCSKRWVVLLTASLINLWDFRRLFIFKTCHCCSSIKKSCFNKLHLLDQIPFRSRRSLDCNLRIRLHILGHQSILFLGFYSVVDECLWSWITISQRSLPSMQQCKVSKNFLYKLILTMDVLRN